MSVGIESFFASALGLQPPRAVGEVKLHTAQRRIDFEISCQGARLACPHCGAAEQRIHDRLRRSWRHLDFFPFEAWLVCQAEMSGDPKAVAAALGTTDRKTIKGLMWGMRKNPDGGLVKPTNAMHWLQHSGLKSARAWRLKMALREVYAHAAAGNNPVLAMKELNAWLSWARRSRLEPFKKLARTLTRTLIERIDAVVRGMTDNRSNAFVEAMNGILQQAKRAARGFRTASTYIAIAFLRMSKLKHLPRHPFVSAQAN